MARTAGDKKRKEANNDETSPASTKPRKRSQRTDESAADNGLTDGNMPTEHYTGSYDEVSDRLPSTSMLKGPPSNQIHSKAATSAPIMQIIEGILAEQHQMYSSVDSQEIREYSPQSRRQANGTGRESEDGSIECYIGTLQSQKLRRLSCYSSETLASLAEDNEQPGSLFNAGGYIYSLDWLTTNTDRALQYIAVSASLQTAPKTLIGDRIALDAKVASSIQIWSIDGEYVSKLQQIVCCDQGRITALRWAPMDFSHGTTSGTILGLLAVCMQDGSVSLIPIPLQNKLTESRTFTNYLRIKAVLELNVGKGVPITVEWFKDHLAVGYSDGWLAIWDMASSLRVGSRRARPLIYTRVAFSPISSLAWHPSGREIYVAAYDGVTRCVQLAVPHMSTMINHSRDVTYALVYCKATETLVMERPELDEVRSVHFSLGRIQSTTSYSHLGRVRVIATSSHHSLLASGGVDGSVRVADSSLVMQKKKSSSNRKKGIVSIIYRLDRHRGNLALRMIDNLQDVPPTYQTRHAMAASAAWDSNISQTALRWNPNKSTKGWLASGTACGLVRVDVV